MADIGALYAYGAGLYSCTSTTQAMQSISSTNFSSSEVWACIMQATIGGDNAGSDNAGIYVDWPDGTQTDSVALWEPSGTNDGQLWPVGEMRVCTASGSDGFAATLEEVGGDYAYARNNQMLALRLSDLDSGDYDYDQDASGPTSLSTSAYEDFASVSIATTTGEKYLLIGSMTFDVGSTNASIYLGLGEDGSAESVEMFVEGEDVATTASYMIYYVFDGDDSTQTWDLRAWAGNSSNEYVRCSLVVIRLDAFEDYDVQQNSSFDPGSQSVYLDLTTNPASITTSGDSVWLGYAVGNVGSQAYACRAQLYDGSTAYVVPDGYPYLFDPTDLQGWNMAHLDTATGTLSYDVQGMVSNTAFGTWDDCLIVGFTVELASNVDRRATVTWAEFEVPNAPRRATVTWAEFEVPPEPRRATVTWAEFEVPNEPRRAVVTWAEMEVPDAPSRRALVTWAEMEVPNEPRRALVTWAEMEVPNAPRRAVVTWAEMEVPPEPRRAVVTWAEFEVPPYDRRAVVTWAEMQVPDEPGASTGGDKRLWWRIPFIRPRDPT